MEKILSSEMAIEEINKKVARKNEIVDLITEKRASFEESDVDTRDTILEDVKALEEEANSIDEEIKGLEETRAKYEEQEARMSMVNVFSTEAVEGRKANATEDRSVEYATNLQNAILTGNEKEARALLTELVEGTAPVSTMINNKVETVWERLSILNEVSKSYFKGILAVPYEESATGAVFHKEGEAAVAEETLTIGKVLLVPTMIKKLLRFSDEVQALTPTEFMDYLFDEVIYQVNLLLETSIINRNATDGVVGITNAALTETVAAELTFNAINEGIAALEDIGDAVVVMNRKTFYSNIMGLVDTQGRPIYQIATDNEGRARHYVNGARVLFTNGLPAYDAAENGAAWAIVGDLKAYKLNLPESRLPIVLYDPYTQADADMNRIIGRILAAGNVVRPKALAQLTKPAA